MTYQYKRNPVKTIMCEGVVYPDKTTGGQIVLGDEFDFDSLLEIQIEAFTKIVKPLGVRRLHETYLHFDDNFQQLSATFGWDIEHTGVNFSVSGNILYYSFLGNLSLELISISIFERIEIIPFLAIGENSAK